MTEDVQIIGEEYLDARGEWCAWWKICKDHGWKDKRLPCPWPECSNSLRWPLYVVYYIGGLDAAEPRTEAQHDVISFGEKYTYIAERDKHDDRERWQWVEYVPKESQG